MSPELYEIKVEDVITVSQLKVEDEGNGLSMDFSDLL